MGRPLTKCMAAIADKKPATAHALDVACSYLPSVGMNEQRRRLAQLARLAIPVLPAVATERKPWLNAIFPRLSLRLRGENQRLAAAVLCYAYQKIENNKLIMKQLKLERLLREINYQNK